MVLAFRRPGRPASEAENLRYVGLVETGDLAGALTAREGLHIARRDVTEASIMLATALLDAQPARVEEALEIAAEIAWVHPGRMDAILLHARARLAAGEASAVADWLRPEYNRTPENATLVRLLAEALLVAGQKEEADHIFAEHADLTHHAIVNLPRWIQSSGDRGAPCNLYLDLLERATVGWLHADGALTPNQNRPFTPDHREVGRDIPLLSHSMIGRRRMAHLRWAVEEVLREHILGDLLEAGVWRGGACILMRGVLAAHGVTDRRVYVVDSFAGLPEPDPSIPQDNATGFDFHLRPELAVSRAEVAQNFERYGLLDEQVVFVEGWFRDTLPKLPSGPISVLRMDGDWYSSTMDVLTTLYNRVPPGGFVICDDYGVVVDSRRAVLDFRRAHGISAPMIAIDGDGVFWRV